MNDFQKFRDTLFKSVFLFCVFLSSVRFESCNCPGSEFTSNDHQQVIECIFSQDQTPELYFSDHIVVPESKPFCVSGIAELPHRFFSGWDRHELFSGSYFITQPSINIFPITIIAILQKSNIWHQSSDEVPAFQV